MPLWLTKCPTAAHADRGQSAGECCGCLFAGSLSEQGKNGRSRNDPFTHNCSDVRGEVYDCRGKCRTAFAAVNDEVYRVDKIDCDHSNGSGRGQSGQVRTCRGDRVSGGGDEVMRK